MKINLMKTRTLFVLTGNPVDVSAVLSELQFKGLITAPYGIVTDSKDVQNAFRYNKCYVCAADDYPEQIPDSAIMVTVYRTGITNGIAADIHVPRIAANLPDIAKQFESLAHNLGVDIGDHKSNSSGLSGSPDGHEKPHCFCCDHRDGKRSDNEPPLYKSKNFFVFPGSGQFALGYLQICPNQHVMSLGELPYEVIQEFNNVLADVEYILKLTFNCKSTLVWENGSGASGIGKAKDSIVHSHVHIIPSNLTSDDVKEVSGFDFETITLDQLPDFKQYSYLLVRTPDEEHWIINNDPKLYIPRQYIRQIVAAEYNIPGDLWNWRKFPFPENMRNTSVRIIDALKRNWDMLPDRIKANSYSCIF